MCFLISIFLCFALVPKLVPRTVDFHWYWYRILKFWYRDNPILYIYIKVKKMLDLMLRQNLTTAGQSISFFSISLMNGS